MHEFCRRVLGGEAAAAGAALEARSGVSTERIELLTAAARACRARADAPDADRGATAEGATGDLGLSAAVARELAHANGALPERQREALALRELLRLSYEQISQVMGVEAAAVAALLARGRLALRVQRRGATPQTGPECAQHERALRVLAHRQDSEPLSGEDDRWMLDHLGVCPRCIAAHAAMLEASACYRAWRTEVVR